MMGLIGKLKCSIWGHNDIVNRYTETDTMQYGKACGRCGAVMFFPHNVKKFMNMSPPPGGDKKTWEDYCNEKEQEFKDKYSASL